MNSSELVVLVSVLLALGIAAIFAGDYRNHSIRRQRKKRSLEAEA